MQLESNGVPWQSILVRQTETIKRAIEIIDASGLQIALIVDEESRLVGTITDGDVRRGLLRNLPLSEPASSIMNRHPVFVGSGATKSAMLALLREHDLHQLPVIDKTGRVVGLAGDIELLTRREERQNPVLLMAGGLGMRLRPLTKDRPKPLLHVGEKPLLEIIIERFVARGYRRFYISVNYLGEMIKTHCGDGSRFGCEITYLAEEAPLGTAGAIGLLKEDPTVPMLVMNGDLLTDLDFDSFVGYHNEHKAALTVAVREYSHQIPYGVTMLEGSDIVDIVEKPVQNYFVSAGIYAISPESIAQLRPARQIDMPDLIRKLVRDTARVVAFPIKEYWLDIGRLEDLERARAEMAWRE